MEKKYKLKISKTLWFSEIYNSEGFIGGGILNPTKNIKDEIWVEIMDDPVYDRASDSWGPTGRIQMHVGSTRRSLEELGTFLLALARYSPPKPGYSASFELKDHIGEPAVHLVFHLPIDEEEERPVFSKIHNVATAIFGPDGQFIEDITLSPTKDTET